MVAQTQDDPREANGDLPHPFDTLSGRVIITLFHSIAIILTLYRLFHRVRIHRFSWDDWLASLALLLIILYLICDWVRIALIQHRSLYIPEDYYDDLITMYRVATSLSTAVLWCSRASLSFSITRILPPSRLRKVSIFVFIACLVVGVVLLIVHKIVCTWARISGVPGPGLPRCLGGATLYTVRTACDLISSLILIALPLYFLLRVTTDLPKSERRLMLTLFTSSLLTFIACLVHAVYILKKNPYAITYSSKLQASISLIVCNLVVVIPNLYTLFWRYYNREVESEIFTETDRNSTAPFGTITTVTQPSSTTNQDWTTRTRSTTTKSSNNTLERSDFELTRITDQDDGLSLRPDLVTVGSTGESGTTSTIPKA